MNAGVMNLLLLVFFIVLMYLMMIRPQRKRDKETREMRDSLTKGDEIVTIGGILGKIDTVKEDTVIISINSSHTKMEITKTAVGSVRRKTESKKADEAPAEEKEEKSASNTKKVTPKKLGARKENAESAEEKSE
ncbi:MAG: preprotein translocase subunit YajC [Mogibacterium sp.]|nr:preprotein translocase subunit YajC [Mogibacterium sp.]